MENRLQTRLESVAAILESYRRGQGWSQAQLGRVLGKNNSEISKILHGKTNPTLSTICEFEEILGIELLGSYNVPKEEIKKRNYFDFENKASFVRKKKDIETTPQTSKARIELLSSIIDKKKEEKEEVLSLLRL